MKKNIPIILIATAIIIVVYLRNHSIKEEIVQDDTNLSYWNSLQTASVSIDTLYSINTPLHQSGLLFTGVTKENQFLLAQVPLYAHRDVSNFEKTMQAGVQHGNYTVITTPMGKYFVTAKHLLEGNMSRINDYGWFPDSAHDVMLKPVEQKLQDESHVSYLMDMSKSLDQQEVQLEGYRVYSDKPYALYFKIRGIAAKADAQTLKQSRPSDGSNVDHKTFSLEHDLYVLRVPIALQNDVMGLSGSGIYLVDSNGRVTDTLVGVQSSRLMRAFQNSETGAIQVTHIAIAFEKM